VIGEQCEYARRLEHLAVVLIVRQKPPVAIAETSRGVHRRGRESTSATTIIAKFQRSPPKTTDAPVHSRSSRFSSDERMFERSTLRQWYLLVTRRTCCKAER
jgi:hypothetical protein